MTYLSPARWDGLVAKALRHHCSTSAASIPVTGFGLDSHELNAAIGLVTSATASIMAGSRLVSWEICGAMSGAPGLTPHAYIPIWDCMHLRYL